MASLGTAAAFAEKPPQAVRVPLDAQKKQLPKDSRSCNVAANYRTRNSGTRTAAEAESRPKGGCCNRRLSGLMGDVAKISFQTQSHSKHENLRSKQQPTIDKSAEAQHAERVPLSNETSDPNRSLVKCHIVPNHRTFIDDYLKILDFIEWLKVAYPEKAKFLTEKSSG